MSHKIPALVCAAAWLLIAARAQAAPDMIIDCAAPRDLESLVSWSVSHSTAQVLAMIPETFIRENLASWRPSPAFLDALRRQSIEIALPLEGSPVLPLVWDTRAARPAALADNQWPRFSFPEDARVHLAEAVESYRKVFGELPSGLALPGAALSDDVARELARFHFEWVVSVSSGGWIWSSLPEGLRTTDYSRWIGSPVQNAEWTALAQARSQIDRYQNSGRADLQRLDAALREIRFLEGSEFFEAPDQDHRRQFTATLSSVYQMIGQAPPQELDSLFSSPGSLVSASVSTGTALESARILTGSDWIRWLDESDDDHGPGSFVYPTSVVTPGSWDIRDVEIRWDDQALKMTFHFASLVNIWGAPAGFSLPVIDAYIDLNHVLGAGCEVLLTGRNARVAPEDAWEYAVSVTGWGASLYRATSRAGFTRIRTLVAHCVPEKGEISVDIPRDVLRGDPLNWGYAIGVSAKGHLRPTDPLDLMPILGQPGPDNFGGAAPGETPASFLDIMVPPGVSQEAVLSSYASGGPVVLPMIHAK